MALFTRTGPDRFNILIRFYDLNIGSRRTLYEPLALMDKAAETTGWRQEGRKWQMQPLLMYLCLNVTHISSCSTHSAPPLHFFIISFSASRTPTRRHGHGADIAILIGKRLMVQTILGWYWRIDSCSKQLIAIGLETDESWDTALNFSSFSWLRQYPANTLKVQGSDYNSWY